VYDGEMSAWQFLGQLAFLCLLLVGYGAMFCWVVLSLIADLKRRRAVKKHRAQFPSYIRE